MDGILSPEVIKAQSCFKYLLNLSNGEMNALKQML